MTHPPPRRPDLIRLVSYNIHKCVGLDRRRDPHRIVDVLRDLDADIVALQEADLRLGARRAALPRDVVTDAIGMTPAPVAINAVSLGWHGNAVLLGQGWTMTDLIRLPLPGLEPRGALILDLAGPSGPLRIATTHLGLRRRDRQRQMITLMAELAHLPERPTALLGDLNEWAPATGFAPLEPFFALHNPGRTYPSRRPMAALDRVGLGPGLRLDGVGVTRAGLAGRASDHLPIWADVARDG